MTIETRQPTGPDTATTYAAREHARSQAGSRAETQPTVPAAAATDLPPGVEPQDMLWEETLGSGGYAARSLPCGTRVRIVDLEGDTCVSLMLHRRDRPGERLCVADTVKLQWQVYARQGYLLLSDMGRVLASIVEDDCGRHDTFCGASLPSDHGGLRSGRDLFLLALAKQGLGERDLAAPINLFKRVRVEPDGALVLDVSSHRPGSRIVLRAELGVIVSLVVLPHRLDGRPERRAGRVRVSAWRGEPSPPDDPLRRATPEACRAFENTDEELAVLEGGAR
jgi:urea carboxylase-associated protein 2